MLVIRKRVSAMYKAEIAYQENMHNFELESLRILLKYVYEMGQKRVLETELAEISKNKLNIVFSTY